MSADCLTKEPIYLRNSTQKYKILFWDINISKKSEQQQNNTCALFYANPSNNIDSSVFFVNISNI